MLEKKLRELPDEQVKVLFAQVTQRLEGRSTVVELKDPMVHTETCGRPLAPVTFQKAAQNDTCPSSIMLKSQIINTKGNVGAAVNQVTTNELASFESTKRVKTNMHNLKANHDTWMLMSYRLSYFLYRA